MAAGGGVREGRVVGHGGQVGDDRGERHLAGDRPVVRAACVRHAVGGAALAGVGGRTRHRLPALRASGARRAPDGGVARQDREARPQSPRPLEGGGEGRPGRGGPMLRKHGADAARQDLGAKELHHVVRREPELRVPTQPAGHQDHRHPRLPHRHGFGCCGHLAGAHRLAGGRHRRRRRGLCPGEHAGRRSAPGREVCPAPVHDRGSVEAGPKAKVSGRRPARRPYRSPLRSRPSEHPTNPVWPSARGASPTVFGAAARTWQGETR